MLDQRWPNASPTYNILNSRSLSNLLFIIPALLRQHGQVRRGQMDFLAESQNVWCEPCTSVHSGSKAHTERWDIFVPFSRVILKNASDEDYGSVDPLPLAIRRWSVWCGPSFCNFQKLLNPEKICCADKSRRCGHINRHPCVLSANSRNSQSLLKFLKFLSVPILSSCAIFKMVLCR